MNRVKSGLRIFTALANLCPAVAVASIGGELTFVSGAAIGILIGHLYSWQRKSKPKFLSPLLLLLFLLSLFLLRQKLWQLIEGDIRSLAYLLLLGQVFFSFALHRAEALRRSLLPSGLTLAACSLLAISLTYLFCILVFTLAALIIMTIAHIEAKAQDCLIAGHWPNSILLWAGSILVFLMLSGTLFLTFPRLSLLSQILPAYLPSRLEVTSALPPAPPSMPGVLSETMPGEEGQEVAPSSTTEIASSGQGAGSEKTSADVATRRDERQGKSRAKGDYPTDSSKKLPLEVGELSSSSTSQENAVIMNVRSPVASYWKGLTLDTYDGQTWAASARPSIEETLIPGAQVYYWQSFTLQVNPGCFLGGYIPVKLFISDKDRLGRRTAPISYRCLSVLPNFRPAYLRQDLAWHPDRKYLSLPPIPMRVRLLAEEVAQGGKTDFDRALRLEKFLQQNYSYSASPAPPPGVERTDYFLFVAGRGTCVQFASAMAVMARLVGLPTRIAIGYLPGNYDLWSGTYRVHARDAHAWVEIHFKEHGWVPFDPTPPRTKEGFWTSVLAGWDRLSPRFQGSLPLPSSRMFIPAAAILPSLGSWGKTLWALGLVPLILLILRFRSRFQQRSRAPIHVYSRLPGREREEILRLFEGLQSLLKLQGFRSRRPDETLSEYLKAMCCYEPSAKTLLESFREVASRAAYDPQPLPEGVSAKIAQQMRDWSVWRRERLWTTAHQGC